jgi:catechol-2,3-dioxygenase
MHISEVILQTASIARTRLFYSKTLELPIVTETEDTISFSAGSSVLTFKAVTGSKPYYHIAFNVTNNKFSDSFEWLSNKLDILPTANGLPIAVYPDWNAESFYFLDNNGSILEFLVRFDLPYHSPEPFGVHDIREISEVGVVTPDVPSATKQFNSAYGIPYFLKTRPAPEFTVMGDDHGLLIVTTKGSAWIPTSKPAQIFPLTIVADGRTLEIQE